MYFKNRLILLASATSSPASTAAAQLPRDTVMAGKALLQQAMQVPAQYPHLNIFQAVDQDGGGAITADELSRALSSSFDEFDLKTCVMLMNMYDGDRSGSIGPGEFEQLWGFLEAWKRGTTARVVVEKQKAARVVFRNASRQQRSAAAEVPPTAPPWFRHHRHQE